MYLNDFKIIETDLTHIDEIYSVETLAFGNEKEAILTKELLLDDTAKPDLSLLAYHNDKAVGHILFTRAYINEICEQPLFHILAPLAIIPEYQKQGLGGLLIREGIEKLKLLGSEMLLVLGHIEYYPKHGFITDAEKLGYVPPYPIPKEFADAWMVQPLSSDNLTIKKGKVICANALDKEEHWRE